jgi:chromosome partitioning protein
MQIIAVIGQKGGTGKTTVALGIAVAADAARRRTIVIDLDPQASAGAWVDCRKEKNKPAVVWCPHQRLTKALEAARSSGADLVVIDTGGHTSESSIAAAEVANLVLVPVKASSPDVLTLPTMHRALVIAGNLEAGVVLVTQAPIQGTRHEEA